MELIAADWDTKTWEKIKRHCEEQLVALRVQNDHKMAEDDRNFLVGRIFQLKVILALDKPRPVVKS